MTSIPKDLRYTKTHEWIQVSGNVGKCGVSDHAQELLTDVVFIELPQIGQYTNRGDRIAVVESVKAVSDIYAPVTGKIIEVNADLEENPGFINSAPYSDGWIFTIEIEDPDELQRLMDADSYRRFVETGGN